MTSRSNVGDFYQQFAPRTWVHVLVRALLMVLVGFAVGALVVAPLTDRAWLDAGLGVGSSAILVAISNTVVGALVVRSRLRRGADR